MKRGGKKPQIRITLENRNEKSGSAIIGKGSPENAFVNAMKVLENLGIEVDNAVLESLGVKKNARRD